MARRDDMVPDFKVCPDCGARQGELHRPACPTRARAREAAALRADMDECARERDAAFKERNDAREHAEQVEAERDALALQVAGLREALVEIRSWYADLSKERGPTSMDRHWDREQAGRIVDLVDQALAASSPSPLLALVEAGKAYVREYESGRTWDGLTEARAKLCEAACECFGADIIEREKGGA